MHVTLMAMVVLRAGTTKAECAMQACLMEHTGPHKSMQVFDFAQGVDTTCRSIDVHENV